MTARQRWATLLLTATIAVGVGIPAIADEPAVPVAEPISDPSGSAPPEAEPTSTPATESIPEAESTPQSPDTVPESPDTVPADSPGSDVPLAVGDITIQEIDVESVQLGVSNTGGNQSASDVSGTAAGGSGGASSGDLATGTATAIGSRDTTGIAQRVITNVDATSRVDVLQISIVFNIGGSLANSGINALASGNGGSASITTGAATAVGNDASTYVTQGADADAGPGQSETVRQHTTTLRIGLAMANSGANAALSTAGQGGAGSASTGAATAVGNSSATSSTQHVEVSARDAAEIQIEQRATVINFGLAFADSGTNQLGAELAAALNSADEDALERLLALILPNLVASGAGLGSGPGATGQISTGDAIAIGNRSTTEILQVAMADATSGTVRISQDAVVVNAGAASATTGGNAIGGATEPAIAPMMAGTQAVLDELTAFLRSLLSDIAAWASGSELDTGTSALTTSLGDFDIGIDRTVAAQRAGAGSSIATRQLAAVVNLAIANANTGGNVMTASSEAGEAAAVMDVAAATRAGADGLPGAVLLITNDEAVVIVTGDASAVNTSLIVLCQRADTPELECLAPRLAPEVDAEPAIDGPSSNVTPTDADDDAPKAVAPATPVPAVAAVAAPASDGRTLPTTGTDPRGLLTVSLVLLLFGFGLVLVSWRTV